MVKTKTFNIGRDKPEQILLIYTGGTLGMVQDLQKGLKPLDFSELFVYLPELERIPAGLIIEAFEKPIDSSNMHPEIWTDLACLIQKHYQEVIGVVILHGTDTMAFTASALSFMLVNLAKPVLLTGAQLPLGVARTDARENLLTSLEIVALKPEIPEVCIYFNGKLLRGNRAKKYESEQFDAFVSENYPLLGEVGVHIHFLSKNSKPVREEPLEVQTKWDNQIAIFTIYPGLNVQPMVEYALEKKLKLVILVTYGSGNAPNHQEFLEALEKLSNQGVLLFNVSQCVGGSVNQSEYATGRTLAALGVISGKDITLEAAIAKAMWLLGNETDMERVKELLGQNLQGEMS